MPDVLIAFLVGCALGFGIGMESASKYLAGVTDDEDIKVFD
jgi:hypothetical protein